MASDIELNGVPATQPKFSIGNTLFFLLHDKVQEKIITGVRLTGSLTEPPVFYSYCFEVRERYEHPLLTWIDEDKLFTSREELIASL